MKTLKDIILEATSEVNPLPRRTKNFIDKHVVQKIDYPVDVEDQFTAKKTKKDHTKGASYKNGEDSVVYEETDLEEKKLTDKSIKQALASAKAQAKSKDQVSLPKAPWDKVAEATMTDTDMKQRENIVKGMKKNSQSFKDRYGDRWKSVMYATATKAAMKEGLDPVGKEDSDVDNDGKHHTASDKYLKNRRKAIAAKMKESIDLDEGVTNMSDARLKFHVLNNVPHGSYGKAEMKAEHDRRKKTMGPAYNAVKPSMNEESEAAYKKADRDEKRKSGAGEYYVTNSDNKKTHSEPFKTSDQAISHANAQEDKTGRIHTVHHIKNGKIQKQWQYSDSAGRFTSYNDHAGQTTHIHEEVEQVNEISRDLARRYIRKVSDKNNTGEASPKEVMKRSPGVALAGKKVYGIGGKARVNATEEVDLDEAFKVGSMKLHDGSSVTLTRESAEALNGLFNQLNSSNKTKMEERLMSDSNGFQEILAFAKEV